MTVLSRDFLDVVGTSDYLTGLGGALSFQSLAERFERIDDEVRRLETLINPAGDSLLARTKVDRMALLQEIAVIILVDHGRLSDRNGSGTDSRWNEDRRHSLRGAAEKQKPTVTQSRSFNGAKPLPGSGRLFISGYGRF